MSDEFTIDAKYKRDNLVAEHERYRKVVEALAERECFGGECICDLRDEARAAVRAAKENPE